MSDNHEALEEQLHVFNHNIDGIRERDFINHTTLPLTYINLPQNPQNETAR